MLFRSADIERIIKLDVFRTLRSREFQAPLEKFLGRLWKDFGDYAQPLCLVAAFLRLTLPENKVYKMLHVINSSDFYIPGYWKAQAVGYAADTYTAMDVLRTINNEVATKILSRQPFPETFCQKFFTAIGVQVFPFVEQYEVMEKFLKGGRKFLIQMICSVIDVQSQAFMNAATMETVFELLRLDKKTTSNDTIKEIVDKAESYKQVDDFDIVGLRQTM